MKIKLVHVEWLDSHSTDGWKPFGEMANDATPAACRTVGWLVYENAKAIMLVASVIDQHHVYPAGTGTMTIPRKCIKSMRTIGGYELRNSAP
jgi:hypothetical protein